MKKRLLIYGILLACLVFSGCSNHVSLGGRVTYSDDGTPLEQGTVAFYASNFLSRGEIRQDGRFVVGTQTDKDGLPPGTYQVAITGAGQYIGDDQHGMPVTLPLIDDRYKDPERSNLTLTVTSSTKNYDLQVDRAPEEIMQRSRKLAVISPEESEERKRLREEARTRN